MNDHLLLKSADFMALNKRSTSVSPQLQLPLLNYAPTLTLQQTKTINKPKYFGLAADYQTPKNQAQRASEKQSRSRTYSNKIYD
jgi:hypothetical protein